MHRAHLDRGRLDARAVLRLACRGPGRCGLLVVAVLAAAGCPAPVITCQRTADCADDAVCVEGTCRRACNASADCDDGLRCVQGACVPASPSVDAARDASLDAAAAADAHALDAARLDGAEGDGARDANAGDVVQDAALREAGSDASSGADAVASDAGPAPDAAWMDAVVGDVVVVARDAMALDGDSGLVDTRVSDAMQVDLVVNLCGNWVVDDGEGCDDGARYPDDGCSPTCDEEPGWHCTGQPSRCCLDGYQDNDQDGSCLPTCATAGLAGCSGHGTCSDATGVAVCTCVSFFEGTDCGQCVVRVKPGGTGDGHSWDQAEDSVPQAVDKASQLAGTAGSCQVRLAGGVYALRNGVTMRSRVMLLGGYAGGGATPDLNDPALYPSVLDGLQDAPHVVVGASTTMLAGLTITGGDATGPLGSPDSTGGGVLLNGASNVTIVDCAFVGNQARSYGGALALEESTATVIDSRFVANRTTNNNEGQGGGAINVYQGSILTLRGSHVVGNHAAGGGGGLRVHDADVTVERCVFSGNRAQFAGGAIRVQGPGSTLILTGSLLAGNLTTGGGFTAGNGGGLRLVEGSARVSGCTVVRNQGFGEAGLSFGTTALSMLVRNSVGWGNLPAQEQFDAIGPDVSHCDVQGWSAGGAGMTSADPQFAPTLTGTWTSGAVVDVQRGQSVLIDGNVAWIPDALTGRSVRVNVDGEVLEYPVLGNTPSELTVLGDLSFVPLLGKAYAIHDDRLQLLSPAIDSGDPAWLEPDLLGRERVCLPSEAPGCPDMGCYEFTPE